MAKQGFKASKRFAALATFSLIASIFAAVPSSAVAATISGLTAEGVTDKGFAQKLLRSPQKAFKASVVADPVAHKDRDFQALASTMKKDANGLYQGEINLQQLRSVADISGLRVSENVKVSVSPLKGEVSRANGRDRIASGKPNTSTSGQQAEPLVGAYKWSGSKPVLAQEADLDSVRAELGLDGTGQTVAVLDTGIDTNAVGLGGRVVYRHDYTNGSQGANCTDDGYLDPYGHGTHVSSIIGGQFDGVNVASEGMAPGVKFLDLRVLNCAGSGDLGSVDQALSWLIDNHEAYGVTVVNLSLGTSSGQADGRDTTSILINRLVAHGVIVVVAAGNSGDRVSTIFTLATSQFAITVGAMSTSSVIGNAMAPFSSQGPTSDGRAGIDLLAPGVGITAAASTSRGGGVVTYSGTSMAAPYTAGLAALMRQQHPEYVVAGETCDLSDTCPIGVVSASMQNQVLDHMETSDWFHSGVDPISGAGAVSATASLLGTQVADQTQPRVSFTAGTDNELTVPAHEDNLVVSIMLDTGYRPDIWADLYFIPTVVYPDGRADAADLGCFNLSDWSCQIFADMWSPRMFNVALPPSSEELKIRVRTTSTVDASVSAIGLTGSIEMNSLQSGSVTLSEGSSIFNEAGNLPSTVSPVTDVPFITSNGDVYAMSKASFAKRAGAYAGIAKFPAGSSRAQAVEGLDQSSQSQLDLLGMSNSGSRLLIGEFPAGSGLVPEVDGDLVYQLVVHDTTTNENIAVGPDRAWTSTYPEEWRRLFPGFDVGNNYFNSNFMSATGNSIGFGYMEYVDGVEKQVIGWQGGNSFDTKVRWYFPAASGAHIEAVSETYLLVTVANAQKDGYELYQLNVSDQSSTLITSNRQYQWTSAKHSADGTALAYRASYDSIVCRDGDLTRTFRPPTDKAFATLNGYRGTGWAVANDCSSITVPVYTPYVPGYAQLRIASSGAYETLAKSLDQSMSWFTDASGTHWVTSSMSTFEAADTNGILDYYRGIRTASFTSAVLSVSGASTIGSTVSGVWSTVPSGFSMSYQWLRNGQPIFGETALTHTVTLGDAGSNLTLRATLKKTSEATGDVFSTNAIGVPSRIYSSAPAPVISGTAILGATLTAVVPTWTPSSRRLHYQWYSGSTPIKGATLSKLKITDSIPQGPITVVATNTLPTFEAKRVQSLEAVGPLKQQIRTPTPTITGSAKVGSSLTAATGTWDTGVAMTSQWLADGSPIAGATARTLKLTNEHAGTQISFQVTATKSGYESVTRISATTATVTGGTFVVATAPAIIGTPAIGNTISVSAGTWGASGVNFTYKWMRGKTVIAGATAPNLTLTTAELGQTITVSVTAAKPGFNSLTKNTAPTTKVGYALTLTPEPVIVGNATVGSTLRVAAGTWGAGVKLTYQWYRDGIAISRATSSSYKLTNSDRSKLITVAVTANKNNFATVVLFSSPKGPIG